MHSISYKSGSEVNLVHSYYNKEVNLTSALLRTEEVKLQLMHWMIRQ